MDIKTISYNYSIVNSKIKPKASTHNNIKKNNYLNFCGNPTKNFQDLSKAEQEKIIKEVKNKFFYSVQRIARKSIKVTKEVSKQYLKDSGIKNNNLLTFERTPVGGYFNPVNSGIVINKRQLEFVATRKLLPEYFDFDKIFNGHIFNLACHESQHKVQATQVYRLANNQENFTDLLVNYVKAQKEVIEKLKKRTSFDDELDDLRKELTSKTDEKEKTEVKLEIEKVKLKKKEIMGQVRSEERKIKKFDIDKVKVFYDEVLQQKGIIPEGSEEEILAKKYLQGFRTYPLLLSGFQSVNEFGTKEAHAAYCKNLDAIYKNNFLEIDAKQKAKEYTEKNIDVYKTYFNKINATT